MFSNRTSFIYRAICITSFISFAEKAFVLRSIFAFKIEIVFDFEYQLSFKIEQSNRHFSKLFFIWRLIEKAFYQ